MITAELVVAVVVDLVAAEPVAAAVLLDPFSSVAIEEEVVLLLVVGLYPSRLCVLCQHRFYVLER